jgi:hypothetical protein
MQVVIFGATGMVGYEVLLEAISKNEITKIITIGRNKTGIKHDKISEIIHNDYTNFNDIKDILQHTKICYYCLGVYQNSVNKDMFWHITVDYVKALIEYFEQINQSVKFCLFSAQGAKQDESSLFLFANAKGKAEKILINSQITNKFIFRPGYINPGPNSKRFSIFEYFFKPLFLIFPFIGINDNDLAKCMVETSLKGNTKQILENSNLRQLVKNLNDGTSGRT